MIFDLLLVGSLVGYVTHRVHRSFAESLSELTWISLGAVSALVLANPTAVTLRLGTVTGAGLADAVGFIIVSAVFLGLRRFFQGVHRRQAALSQAAVELDKDEGSRQVNLSALIPALGSALIMMSFGIVLVSALPAIVLPGGENALHKSALAGGILEVAEPIRPSVNGLVIDAWRDSERFISGTPNAGRDAESHALPSLFPKMEWELLGKVNKARIAKGIVPLVVDPALRAEARRQAREMAARKYFSHESPTRGNLQQRLDGSGYSYSVASENLANALGVDQAFDALMASDHHRENMLNEKFRKTGIGISRVGDSPLTFTQVFSD